MPGEPVRTWMRDAGPPARNAAEIADRIRSRPAKLKFRRWGTFHTEWSAGGSAAAMISSGCPREVSGETDILDPCCLKVAGYWSAGRSRNSSRRVWLGLRESRRVAAKLTSHAGGKRQRRPGFFASGEISESGAALSLALA